MADEQYKYLGHYAVSEPVVMAPGDIVTLDWEVAQPLVDEGKLMKLESAQPHATDAAIELADKEGVNLSAVHGTGSDGRITVQDVQAYLASKPDEPEHEEGE